MENWHRIDDPECCPPKDGQWVRCMVDGMQIRLQFADGKWRNYGNHPLEPTHWQYEKPQED